MSCNPSRSVGSYDDNLRGFFLGCKGGDGREADSRQSWIKRSSGLDIGSGKKDLAVVSAIQIVKPWKKLGMSVRIFEIMHI
jgi:hypothetical protein